MSISSAVTPGAVARVVGVKTEFVNLNTNAAALLPQRVAVFGEGSDGVVYPNDKFTATSSKQVGDAVGYGSPLHLAARQIFPDNGDGVGTIPVTFYPLAPDGGAVAAAGDITPAGAATGSAAYRVNVSGTLSEDFTVVVGDTVASICTKIADAINAVLEMPVTALASPTEVTCTAKWSGATGNDITLAIVGGADVGITFGITQPVGGLLYPSLTAALAQVGDVWETMAVNTLGLGDTVTLDEIEDFGESRWGPLTKKPVVFFSGSNETDAATLTAITDARKTDRVNAAVTAPGSDNLPLQIAARAAAKAVVVANANPAHDYARQALSGISAGTDGEQWDYLTRDQAVKKGASTVEYKDGVVNLSDTVTFYHPTGETNPAYRYVVDIVKLQNIIYNLDLIFNSAEWDGAPLIPDDQPTVNPDAKQPKAAVAAVNSLIDALGLQAIISDPETAKKNTVAGIDENNPKRLNVALTVQLSGNVNIISVDLFFGFYFGNAAA